MKLDDLNQKLKDLTKDSLDIIQCCESPDELEAMASTVAFILASMTSTTDEQKGDIIKAGQAARSRIEEKEKLEGTI